MVKRKLMVTRALNNEVRIYLDTCILQGAFSRRTDEDVVFMKDLREKD